MQGDNPSVQEALDVYHILTEGNNDLRQPVGLETQLLKESSMDSEVGMSMLQLLSVRASMNWALYLRCLDCCVLSHMMFHQALQISLHAAVVPHCHGLSS